MKLIVPSCAQLLAHACIVAFTGQRPATSHAIVAIASAASVAEVLSMAMERGLAAARTHTTTARHVHLRHISRDDFPVDEPHDREQRIRSYGGVLRRRIVRLQRVSHNETHATRYPPLAAEAAAD